MQKPPHKVASLMDDLVQSVRYRDHGQPSFGYGVKSFNYGEAFRESVWTVVHHSFPFFCERISKKDLDERINGFIEKGENFNPEFHNIATGFVHYIQKNKGRVSDFDFKLLEYEWLLFSVEIDPISTSFKKETIFREDSYSLKNGYFMLNQTAQFVQLPFTLRNNKIFFLENDEVFAHIVYRAGNHSVLSSILSAEDLIALTPFYQAKSIHFSKLEQEVSSFLEGFDLLEWIKVSCRKEILYQTNL